MDRARLEGPEERQERRGARIDRAAPGVREPHAVELWEQPREPPGGRAGVPVRVGGGPPARAASEHRPPLASADDDAVVLGRTQIVEPLPTVADARVRRPADRLEPLRDRLGRDHVVRDDPEAPAEPRGRRRPRPGHDDDVVRLHAATVRPDNAGPPGLDRPGARPLGDVDTPLEEQPTESPRERGRLADRAVGNERPAADDGRIGDRARVGGVQLAVAVGHAEARGERERSVAIRLPGTRRDAQHPVDVERARDALGLDERRGLVHGVGEYRRVPEPLVLPEEADQPLEDRARRTRRTRRCAARSSSDDVLLEQHDAEPGARSVSETAAHRPANPPPTIATSATT